MIAPADPSNRPCSATLTTKLPKVGTTIFTVMSSLATEHRAVNLGQGFPDFDCDPALVEAVADAMRAGHNQYPPMAGVAALRECIAAKIEIVHAHRYDPGDEITVTAGATQAIFTAVLAVVRPGDEVIVLEPVYDSYVPSIELAGATAVAVPMREGFRIDWPAVRAACTTRTRAILVNSPHNPTGTILRESDLRELASIACAHDLIVISDEVYEHMVFDGQIHESVSRYPELAARSFVISSFGKTFHVTGWKLGYCAAPAALTAEFRKVHQFNVFTAHAPTQHGIAHYMTGSQAWRDVAAFYQRKRDLFRQGLARTRFRLLDCEGTFFQLVDYSAISDRDETAFAQWLTAEIGVAAIPLSAFYEQGVENRIVRFCFAKTDATLEHALERLAAL